MKKLRIQKKMEMWRSKSSTFFLLVLGGITEFVDKIAQTFNNNPEISFNRILTLKDNKASTITDDNVAQIIGQKLSIKRGAITKGEYQYRLGSGFLYVWFQGAQRAAFYFIDYWSSDVIKIAGYSSMNAYITFSKNPSSSYFTFSTNYENGYYLFIGDVF